MKTDKLKKTLLTLGLVFLTATLFYSEAFSWGFATHTYIDGELGKGNGQRNDNEILQQSTVLCASDIHAEIMATIEHIDQQLQTRGISY